MTDKELFKGVLEILNINHSAAATMLNKSLASVRGYSAGQTDLPPEVTRALLEAVCTQMASSTDRHQFINITAQKLAKKRKQA